MELKTEWIVENLHGPGEYRGIPEKKKPRLAIFFYWLIPGLGRPGCRCIHRRSHTWHLHWFRMHPWVQRKRLFDLTAAAITKEINDDIIDSIRKEQGR